jgi:methylmalonyl-CoA mutase N-terminal domain/subunit
LIEKVDELGGAAEAIRAGFFQEEIGRSAYQHQLRIEAGETVVVGVNKFGDGQDPPIIPAPDFSSLERRAGRTTQTCKGFA